MKKCLTSLKNAINFENFLKFYKIYYFNAIFIKNKTYLLDKELFETKRNFADYSHIEELKIESMEEEDTLVNITKIQFYCVFTLEIQLSARLRKIQFDII